MQKQKKELVIILGPTAVGKSYIGCLLAKKINAQIISADSMQVYKGLPILTNYPSVSMRKAVRHHLISIIGLDKEFNAAKFTRFARQAIKQVLKKGKIPIVAGGSGMYINALLDGVFKGPGEDKSLRGRLNEQASRLGNIYLYDKLKELDPQTAAAIHPNNLKRVIRALEVCIKTGKKMSEIKKNRKGIWGDFDVRIIGLNRNRDELYKLIDSRVEAMFDKGAIGEAKRALKQKRLSKTAAQIIGINEIAGFLNKEYNKEEAKRLIKRNTRHFAKRQITWFGRDKRINWLEINQNQKTKDIVDRILKLI